MTLAAQVWAAAGALAAASAAVLLLRAARRRDPARSGYRWLAVVAVSWGAGLIAQEVAGPGTFALSLADVLTLPGLVALVIGFAGLADVGKASSTGPAGLRGGASLIGRAGTGRVADAAVLILALFSLIWVVILAAGYQRSALSAGAFTTDLIHPAADLIAAGCVLTLAALAGWRGLGPALALVAVLAGDALAVVVRVDPDQGGGPWPQLAWLVGICLLGASPLLTGGFRLGRRPARSGAAGRDGQRAVRPELIATCVAIAVAAVAAVVLFDQALAGPSSRLRLQLAVAAVLVLAVSARIGGLLREAAVSRASTRESRRQFHQLAEHTSDVVLLCDRSGAVRFASQAIARYGYEAGGLDGATLADLVHPDDKAAGMRVAAAALRGDAAGPARLACRVRAADGTWRHVEATVSRYAEPGSADLLLVTARDVSDQVALRRQVTHLTFHDSLTGLPNRAFLEERAKDLAARPADQAQPSAGAIFVDLDGFTAVNDSVGHGAGDALLAQAAHRLRTAVPGQDTVARWGGDEFAVLAQGAASPQEIVDVAERLVSCIAAEPFRVADRDITLTASVGVALAGPDGTGHLLRNADLAMARAKEAGGDRTEVFASHMHADVVRRLELATDLRQALADDGLDIEYLPLVELSTSRVTGVEALVRWTRHGEPVPPAEFLGIAETSGLIVPLGEWVLAEAAGQAVRWRAAGWDIGLSVNLSLRQVSATRFADTVLTTLADAGLPPDALSLEVTERVLIEGAEPMISELAELRAAGIRLAIDDFGTGYASLAYLRELPVDIIKIDPSFVAGLGRDGTLALLTRTIVQVGHDLAIEVVAEGIERPEQLELLRAMGCGLGQGYLVARPMTAAGIAALTGSREPDRLGWTAAGGGPFVPGIEDDEDQQAPAALAGDDDASAGQAPGATAPAPAPAG
jgi:diguanylate cyclase (GGDEF)-like protein/PAS domain S-box-containing protein